MSGISKNHYFCFIAYGLICLALFIMSLNLRTYTTYINDLEKTLESERHYMHEIEQDLVEALDTITILESELNQINDLINNISYIIEEESSIELSESFIKGLSEYIYAINKAYNLKYGFEFNPALLLSFIRVESVFNPNLVSSAGAKGLMQLMDTTGRAYAQELGIEHYDPFNWKQNIEIGWYYFNANKELMGKDKALVVYNQGYYNLNEAIRLSKQDPHSYLRLIEHFERNYNKILNGDFNERKIIPKKPS